MSYDDYDQDAAEARFDDEMAQLERIAELEELVRDWQVLYENPDLSGYTRLRNRTLNLGIEVIDE